MNTGRYAAVCLMCLMVFSGVNVVAGIEQPSNGFRETQEVVTILDSAWSVRSNVSFAVGETFHVNVSSTVVDVLANGGNAFLEVRDFQGNMLSQVNFVQVSQNPSNYTSNVTINGPSDWYYLKVKIDDTNSRFEAIEPVAIGPALDVHSIRTFTDDSFTRESDVFTSTSTVWVEVVGNDNGDKDKWDLFEYIDKNSVVGGAQGGFDNYKKQGGLYRFSIDLSQWKNNYQQGWYYTLSVKLKNNAFDGGKLIEIYDPSIALVGTDLAPAKVSQGQVDVEMLSLDLSLDANWGVDHGNAVFNLERVRIGRPGAGADTDIVDVSLYNDVNGDRKVDPGDLLLDRVWMPGFPVWLGSQGASMEYLMAGTTLHLLVVYDFSPQAVVGNFDGAEVPNPPVNNLQFHGTYSYAVTGPTRSTDSEIIGALVVSVENDPGLAPAKVPVGTADVAMDRFRFVSNGQPTNLTGVTVNLTGSGNIQDIASVRVYLDDGDGKFDPARDTLSAPEGAYGAQGSVTFTGLGILIDQNPVEVFLVYNITLNATVGDKVGTRVAENTSFTLSRGFVYDVGFPLDSGVTTIVGPMMSVTPTDLAGGRPLKQARQGEQNVQMLQLNLSVSAGISTLYGVRVDLRGSASDIDIASAKLWYDSNRNGNLDIGDTLLGSTSFVGRTATFPGLSLKVGSPVYENLFLTYDVAMGATIGATFGAELKDERYLSVDVNTTVDPANFGMKSTDLTVVAKGSAPIVSVMMDDLAKGYPQVRQGEADIQMLMLNFTVDAMSANITGLRLDLRGSGTDPDISEVRVYLDADGDAGWGPPDPLLAKGVFVGGVLTVGGFKVNVSSPGYANMFVIYNISLTARVGDTVGVQQKDASYVAVDPPAIVNPADFPIRSSNIPIVTRSVLPVLTLAGKDLAASQPNLEVAQGARDVPMLQMEMSLDRGVANLTGLRLDKTGSSMKDGDVESASLWQDDGDGSFNASTDTQVASGSFVGGTLTLGGLKVTLGTSVTRMFITYSISQSADTGVTVGVSIKAPAYLQMDNATVEPGGLPASSSDLTIVQASIPPPKGSITVTIVNERDLPMEGVELTLAGAGSNLSGITDAQGGYVFTDLDPGTYTLTASAQGYTDQSMTVVLSAPDRMDKSIQMKMVPPSSGGEQPVQESSILPLLAAVAVALLLALLAIMFLRRRRCEECGTAVTFNEKLCPQCKEKKKEGADEDEGPPAERTLEDAPTADENEGTSEEAAGDAGSPPGGAASADGASETRDDVERSEEKTQ